MKVSDEGEWRPNRKNIKANLQMEGKSAFISTQHLAQKLPFNKLSSQTIIIFNKI